MKLLAGKLYDPASNASKATSSLLGMTAMDTTNLRLSFTAPSNGSVLVRIRCVMTGATSNAVILLGVLDHTNSDAVVARQAPIFTNNGAAAAATTAVAASMVITGLVAGQSYTYDAAYGVEVVVASTVIRLGGPDDATGTNAWGGVAYEIWDTQGLLGSAAYDPSSASVATAISLAAMTAIDTTNLRLTFTAPSSGIVMVRLRGVVSGTTTTTFNYMWGVLDGATVRLRGRGIGGKAQIGSLAATDQICTEFVGLVTGLTGGTSYTWDAAYTVDSALTNGVIKIGGPNDTTTDNAWGQFAFDIWNTDSLPRAIGAIA